MSLRSTVLGALAALGLSAAVAGVASCSSSTPDVPSADAGADDAGGVVCPASGVSKGPWALAMTRTTMKVRWEACRGDATPGIVFRPEGGGAADVHAPSASTPVTLAEEHAAPLNTLNCPADEPGTFFTHEVALSNLAPGTCYRYELEADRARGGRFCTSQPDGGKVHFLAIGDTNPLLGPATGKVFANVLPFGQDFIVHAGDMQYYDSGLETWAGWFPKMQPLLAQGAIQPALGNHEHEVDDELDGYSLRFFGDSSYGGRSMQYRFETGGIYFHMLNTEEPFDPASPQGQWLTGSLADASTQPNFRASIVAMHRPFATCGDNAQADDARRGYASTFAQYKVPLVIQAHIHIYERFEIDGLTYVTTGGGGGAIGQDDANLSRAECALRKSSGPFFHAIDFVIDPPGQGAAIHGKVIDDANAVRDEFAVPLP